MTLKENEIIKIFNNAGIKNFGFVHKTPYDSEAPSGHRISDLLPTAQSALVYILPVDRDIVDTFPQDFAGEHYEAYVQEKKKVTEKLFEAGEKLVTTFRENGFDALIVPKGSREYIGWISLKHLGYYAGLGVFGRNSLLLNPVYSPYLRISAVLTEYNPSEFSTFIDLGQICHDCNKCIANCPAHALEIPQKGEMYRILKEKCHRYFCKMRNSEYIPENANVNCGLCRQVCPVGKNRE